MGGEFGEMTVVMSYLFQGSNCRGPEKYRDMLLDIGTEQDPPHDMRRKVPSAGDEAKPLQRADCRHA